MSDINFNQVTNFKINNHEVSGIKIDGKDAWSGGGEKSKILHFTLRGGSSNATVTLERGEMSKYFNFYYSYDNKEWTMVPWVESHNFELNSQHKTVYIKGNNPWGWLQAVQYYTVYIRTSGELIDAGGSIMSLLDETGEQTNIPGEYLFQKFFMNCANLVTAPELPATTLAIGCYNNMFNGCTSLIKAPKLPATTLASSCYQSMFSGCTSLTQAPKLPATTLASSCYQSMFFGCTSLTQAPELPATTLEGYCYRSMFSNCTSLTQAPKLPAINLTSTCYYEMFSGCASLNTIPELPATTLATQCYQNMFEFCSNIKMSTIYSSEYPNKYEFGTTPSSYSYCSYCMFYLTGGDYTTNYTDVYYKTLYTSNEIIYAND